MVEKNGAGQIESLNYPDATFDIVVCNAVLHFAESDAQFLAMMHGIWRVLRDDGMLFCRLASSIRMTRKNLKKITGRRYLLPDKSIRYLVDEKFLICLTKELKAGLIDPLKTTVVQDQRCMTIWIIRKSAA